MTDREFVATSRAMALGILAACHRSALSPDDATAVAGAALTESLAQMLGPVGAVERLRDLADTIERQLLAEMH